jgi:ribosomal protein L44E
MLVRVWPQGYSVTHVFLSVDLRLLLKPALSAPGADLTFHSMAMKLGFHNSLFSHSITADPSSGPDVLSSKLAKMNLGNSEPRQVAGESSVQRLPPDQPPQPGRRANKRRRYDQNDEENGGGNRRDGARYPHAKRTTLLFECPFCKLDPRRYDECRGRRLTRLSDVIQHINRQHLLVEVRLGFDTVQPEDVILYCARCRYRFHGTAAEYRRRSHLTEGIQCQIANIEQTGVLLLREFEELRTELRLYTQHSETFRWYILWDRCFPGKPRPLSPYVEIILPRPQVQLMIEAELQSLNRLSPAEIRSIARRSTDRIYTTSSPAPQPRRPSPQAPPNTVQRAPEPTYMPPNRALSSQPLQPFTQPQGLGDDSDLSNPGAFEMHLGLNASQGDNSSLWNNTFNTNYAPSQILGFGTYTTSENNIVDLGYPTARFEPASEFISQDDDDLNLYGGAVNRRGS